MKLKKDQIVGANYHYTRYSLPYFVKSMERLGVRQIEFYAADPHLYVENCTPERAKDIRRRLDDSGIKVACFTPEQCSYPINIALDDDYARSYSVHYYDYTLEYAAILGSPLVQIVGGRGYFDGDLEGAWERSKESLRLITERAKSYGITIVLEASSYMTSTVVNNCTHIRQMIDEIKLPNLRGMIDTNALYKAEEDFETCVKLLGEDLVHMHFIDATENAYSLIPGTGVLPMAEWMQILADHGYQGVLTPELWGTRYAMDPEDAMKRSLAFCYQYTE